jgi:uncharacterized protein YfiM (DUF2279 family)
MRRLILLLFLAFLPVTIYAKPDAAGLKYPDSVKKSQLRAVLATEAALYAGSMAYLQFIWYKDHKAVPFHFYNDSKGYLQIDKFGHTFGAYLESYIGYHALRCAGVKKGKALLLGGTLGIILQTPIEVWDGLYEGWGFSWSDMAANTAGSAIVIGQELLFDEQVVKYKFSFSPSPYARQANGFLGTGFDQLFNDYNGHTYWLSMGINRIVPHSKIPDWLNISVGYSANGMFGEFENIAHYRGVNIPATTRYRQYLLSLDVDWTKIKTNNKFLKTLFQGMFMIKLPFPAIEINSLGKVSGHWLYY